MIRTLVSLGAVTVAAGLWLGWPRPAPDISAAIARAADHHAASTGGTRSDCVGRPSTLRAVLVVVTCDTGSARHVYPVDRQGRILPETARPGAQS